MFVRLLSNCFKKLKFSKKSCKSFKSPENSKDTIIKCKTYRRPCVWKNAIKMERKFLRSFLLPSLLLLFASCFTIAIVIEDEVEPDGETIAPTRDKSESHCRVIVSQIIFKFICSGKNSTIASACRENGTDIASWIRIKKCTENFRWENIRFFVSRFTPFSFVCFSQSE